MKKVIKKVALLICTWSIFMFNSCIKSEALNIMLDPGHGGEFRGCFCEYDGHVIEEKDLNFKIALFIKEELSKYKTKNGENVNVYLTRGPADNPSLSQRIEIGVKKNADIVISLHNNASSDDSRRYRGAMALVTSSHFNNKYDIEEVISKNILAELNKLGISISHDTISGIANNDNGLLRRFATDGYTYPNGELADWYGIIMHGILNNIPSVLIEHAYLDNEEDYREFLCTDDKLRKLAKADVNGIVKYYNLVFGNSNIDTKSSVSKETVSKTAYNKPKDVDTSKKADEKKANNDNGEDVNLKKSVDNLKEDEKITNNNSKEDEKITNNDSKEDEKITNNDSNEDMNLNESVDDLKEDKTDDVNQDESNEDNNNSNNNILFICTGIGLAVIVGAAIAVFLRKKKKG